VSVRPPVGGVVLDSGVEVEPCELSEGQRLGGSCVLIGHRPAGDQMRGFGAGADGPPVDCHVEGVAADLVRTGDRVSDGVGALGVVVGLVGGPGEGVAEGLLVSLPRAM
jgi:hypothetical protein